MALERDFLDQFSLKYHETTSELALVTLILTNFNKLALFLQFLDEIFSKPWLNTDNSTQLASAGKPIKMHARAMKHPIIFYSSLVLI